MAYTVLVADDEAEIRSLLRLYLEKDGYRVLEAGDGIHAVSLLQKEEIDLVLLDIMMPVHIRLSIVLNRLWQNEECRKILGIGTLFMLMNMDIRNGSRKLQEKDLLLIN